MNDDVIRNLSELTEIIKSVMKVEHEMRARAAEAARLSEAAQQVLARRLDRLQRLTADAAAIDEDRAAAGKRLLATVEQIREKGGALELAAYPGFAADVGQAAAVAREYLEAMAAAMKRMDAVKAIFSAEAADFDEHQ